jgi:hypothetical protein
MSDPAALWGLPPGFEPVRLPISDDAKQALRPLLGANEPVLVMISNEGDSIALIATPLRVLSVKTGGVQAGATGASVKEYPYEGITDMKIQSAAINVKIALHFKTTNNGRTVEVGLRAKLAKDHVDNLMPFESTAGAEAFKAIYDIWVHKTGGKKQLGA